MRDMMVGKDIISWKRKVIRMTKIDIVSGFLGAGKTTLIKKLLSEVLKNTKVVLIENEFGEIGIDGGFLKDAGIEIKEMNSGCICCSLVGDFGTSLREVLNKYAPERILIEPSGVGKLSDVIKAVEGATDGQDVQLNSAVAVVDATKCKMYSKNFGEFFINQIAYAETIILSRTDKMNEEKLKNCIEIIRQYNGHATVITTPWEQLEGVKILETMENTPDLEKQLMDQVLTEHDGHHHEHEENCTCGCHSHEEHEHHHEHDENCSCGCHEHEEHHHADEVFTSWGFETPAAYTVDELKGILEKLEDEKKYGFVLRSKGMVPGADGTWLYFDYVPGESEVRTGKPDITGKVCVIGSKLVEDNLKNLFQK